MQKSSHRSADLDEIGNNEWRALHELKDLREGDGGRAFVLRSSLVTSLGLVTLPGATMRASGRGKRNSGWESSDKVLKLHDRFSHRLGGKAL